MNRILKYWWNENDNYPYEYEVEESKLIEALSVILVDEFKTKTMIAESIVNSREIIEKLLEEEIIDIDKCFEDYESQLLSWFESEAREECHDYCWEKEHQSYLTRYFNENR